MCDCWVALDGAVLGFPKPFVWKAKVGPIRGGDKLAVHNSGLTPPSYRGRLLRSMNCLAAPIEVDLTWTGTEILAYFDDSGDTVSRVALALPVKTELKTQL